MQSNEEALNQANDTTGLREMAASIGSNIAGGVFGEASEIDWSERPRVYLPFSCINTVSLIFSVGSSAMRMNYQYMPSMPGKALPDDSIHADPVAN